VRPTLSVDCIDIVELGALAERGNRHATALAGQSVEAMAAMALSHYQFHQLRLEREKTERELRLARKAEAKLAHLASLTVGHDLDRKRARCAPPSNVPAPASPVRAKGKIVHRKDAKNAKNTEYSS